MKYKLNMRRNWTPNPRRNKFYTQADNYRVPEDIPEADAEAAIRAGAASRIDLPKPVAAPEPAVDAERPAKSRKWRKRAPENKVVETAEDKADD